MLLLSPSSFLSVYAFSKEAIIEECASAVVDDDDGDDVGPCAERVLTFVKSISTLVRSTCLRGRMFAVFIIYTLLTAKLN